MYCLWGRVFAGSVDQPKVAALNIYYQHSKRDRPAGKAREDDTMRMNRARWLLHRTAKLACPNLRGTGSGF